MGSSIEAQLFHLVLGHQKRTHRKPELPIPLNGNEKSFRHKVKKKKKKESFSKGIENLGKK